MNSVKIAKLRSEKAFIVCKEFKYYNFIHQLKDLRQHNSVLPGVKYWADAITIALEVCYKENLQYIILHIKNEKNSHIIIISKTRRERDEKTKKNNDDSKEAVQIIN